MNLFARLSLFVMMLGFQPIFAQDCANGRCFKTPVRNGLATVGRAAVNTVQAVANAQPLKSAAYSVRSYRAGCGCGCPACNCGASQSSAFYVGGYNYEGYLITSIGSSASTSTVSALGVRSRKVSREAILEAANKAHADCTINSDELRAIKIACMSPRMLSKIEDLIIEKAQNSGAYTFALKANGEVDKQAINWEAIGDFIVKIAPIIFKLIELFAYDTSIDNSVQIASVESVPNFVATRSYEYFLGC